MDGWIKLHRKILDNQDLMSNSNLLALFIYILLSVDRRTGMFKTGRFKLSKALGMTNSNTYKTLKRLKTLGMVTLTVTMGQHGYTAIRVNKWEEYQSDVTQESNTKVTLREHYGNTKVTHNKNKEGRSKNKELDTHQLAKLQIRFPTKSVNQEYEKCMDYISSTGKTYKDYEAMFRNWLRRSPDTRVPPPKTIQPPPELPPEQRKKSLEALANIRESLKEKFNMGGKDGKCDN